MAKARAGCHAPLVNLVERVRAMRDTNGEIKGADQPRSDPKQECILSVTQSSALAISVKPWPRRLPEPASPYQLPAKVEECRQSAQSLTTEHIACCIKINHFLRTLSTHMYIMSNNAEGITNIPTCVP